MTENIPLKDEEPNFWERKFMKTTHKHIESLEQEGILEVKAGIKIRDNMYRVLNQIVNMNAVLDDITMVHKRNFQTNQEFINCLIRHIDKFDMDRELLRNPDLKRDPEESKLIQANADQSLLLITRKDYEFCKFERKFSTSAIENKFESLKTKGKKITFDLPEVHLNERVGSLEAAIMHETYGLISKWSYKYKEKINLDVLSNVRMRDNFNRVRIQANKLQKKINAEMDKIETDTSFDKCLKEYEDKNKIYKRFFEANWAISDCYKSFMEKNRDLLQQRKYMG